MKNLMAAPPLFKKITYFGVKKWYSSCINLNDPYIISAVRTPIGCFQGKLASLSAVQLGTKAMVAAVERSNVPKEDIKEFVLGCCMPANLGQSPSYQIRHFAGLPSSIITYSINKLCASGMKAIAIGCQVIQCSCQDVVAVAGIESVSNVPYALRRKNPKFGNICLSDLIFHDGIIDSVHKVDVTAFAEISAKEYKMTRQIQDDYAIQSYQNAATSLEEGKFADEIIPVVIKNKDKSEEIVCEDEEIRRLDVKRLSSLTPDMGEGGTITSGNSAGFGDGAAVMILASGNYVIKKNLKPLARIVSNGDGALCMEQFSTAPSIAIATALMRANLKAEDIAVWEISETFACTCLITAQILGIDVAKMNPHGGCISLNHPFGMTGMRIVGHLAHTLNKGEYGCAAIPHSTGGASAMIIEKM